MARGGSPPRASRAARRHGLVAVRSALFAEEARRRLPFASTASTGASSARARAIPSRVSAITSMTDTNAWRAPAAAWRAGPSADVRCTSTMPSFVAEEDLPHLDLREAVEPGGRGAVGAVRALEPRRLFAERGRAPHDELVGLGELDVAHGRLEGLSERSGPVPGRRGRAGPSRHG